MKRPNFFIIGAPRCGTTALYTYLGEHPNIFMPEIKELHFFSSDFPGLQKVVSGSLEGYLGVFAGAGEHHLAIGEASTHYLYSKVALTRIREFDPSAKIIVSLRNPVDFVQSLHQVNLSLLRENEADLAKAWDLQEVRREGKMIPSSCREPELVQYGELGQFGKYVEKVFAVFPKDQVLILIFEDFIANPKSVYETILSFLGVPSDGRSDFPPVNTNYEYRSGLLARIIHPPQVVFRPLMKIFSMFGTGFMKKAGLLYNKVELFNARRVPRKSVDPALRARLLEYFKEDIYKLSKLLDRDLSFWLASN